MKEHGMAKDETERGHLEVTKMTHVSDSCKQQVTLAIFRPPSPCHVPPVQVEGCFAKANANRTNLHVDDRPFRSRSSHPG
jgi:hypothetical protein